jgi:tRNA(Ile2) C34 agmatinyltransferase TiaS
VWWPFGPKCPECRGRLRLLGEAFGFNGRRCSGYVCEQCEKLWYQPQQRAPLEPVSDEWMAWMFYVRPDGSRIHVGDPDYPAEDAGDVIQV